MPLLIKNGNIVTATDNYIADIYCESDTITRIGVELESPPDTLVIDATGKYVFPGFIDPHVHIYCLLWAPTLRTTTLLGVERP